MQTKEIWKPVKDYEKWYLVSNTGKVKSLGREVSGIDKAGDFYRIIKSVRILKPSNVKDYDRVVLCDLSEKKCLFVHRIVAEAFIEKLKGKAFVNHINGNKTDNQAENLEWCTRSENQLHAVKIGLQKPHFNHPFKKRISILKNNQVIYIAGVREICRKFKLDHRGVQRTIAGQFKSYKGYTFKVAG